MSRTHLERFLRPTSIAVIGGGAWCEAVLEQCRKIGFDGALWAVHPKRDNLAGVKTVARIADLPAAPDAAFVGVNRDATIEVIGELAAMGAGGAVCFASGFRESGAEDLNQRLIAAAGDLAILGPNCYGVLNYLDRVALWPDQHGGAVVESGVAIVTQSSNIAINLTMQQRGLPVAYVVTAGNQAQQGIAAIAAQILRDPRVTALGLHIEGFGDIRAFEALADLARALGKPIVALKVGTSHEARAATVSHTASLAGSDAGAAALMSRLGILRARSLTGFLEVLKLMHVFGRFAPRPAGPCITSLSCSGGEASVMADAAQASGVRFAPLSTAQRDALAVALGPLVTLANPLDYHTFIWRDRAAMAGIFATMTGPDIDLTVIVLDFPRADRCGLDDWQIAVAAIEDAARTTGARFAVVASLGENLPEDIARRLIAGGIVPLTGIDDAMSAIALAGSATIQTTAPVLLPRPAPKTLHTLTEAAAKLALAAHGVVIPEGARASTAQLAGDLAQKIGFPVVLKGEGIAHKSEAGAVHLGLTSRADVVRAAAAIPANGFFVEEMVADGVAEVLIGVTRDPAHGFVLTLAAGGVLTELLRDQVSVLVPAPRSDVRAALQQLAVWPLLRRYRGSACGNIDALVDMVMAVQDYVAHHHRGLAEVEINPVIVTPQRAVAVDALITQEG